MTPHSAPSTVDRRPLVPGELRHVALARGHRDFDVVAAISALFGRRKARKPRLYLPVTLGLWGVAIEERVFGWSQVQSVTHQIRYHGSSGNARKCNELEFELADSIVRAEDDYDLSLELLADLHPRLGYESRRPLALALDGGRGRAVEPGLFGDLLGAVRTWLESDDGRAATTVVEGDYRIVKRRVHPGLAPRLSSVLLQAPSSADAGPFAAIVAAELGVEAVGDAVAAMASSPSPFVAAVAIGAALRLGVSAIRVGKVEQVEPWVDAATSSAIMAWAAGNG